MGPQPSIAHYRVTTKLGEGGMGEVWRATDTKLNRDVAIKVLPEAFVADRDRLARFTREAQVLASLNHPNIAAIYGVEERALVMELVEGPTLAERIAKGRIPLEEALVLARQIAEALEYAHERGVIHRDLKPANIKITPEGRVKVLDFGLAKAVSGEGTAATDPISSPTVTMRSTQPGVILGTAAYMSPEQARGQNVDRRADIWAFGVILFEMLTGRQLFPGRTVSDTLAHVLKGDIDLTGIPAEVRPTLERCLRRDPLLRWHSIDDVFLLLEQGVPAASPVARRKSVWPWTLAGALAVALAVAGVGWWNATRPVDHPLVRFNVDLGPEAMPGLNLTAAISPDGRRLVFPARGPDGRQQLATRLLDQAQITLLPGTENSYDPFFSPDSQSIGFFAGPVLRKVSVLGGAPETVVSGQMAAMGGSWGRDGNIVTSLGQLEVVSTVSSGGGVRREVTKLNAGEITHRWPQLLPDGGAVLYTASNSVNQMEGASIEVVSVKASIPKVLVRGGYFGRYLPTGHLIFIRQGVLFGVKFDPEALEVHGTPVPLLEDVAANPVTGGGQFDFSNTGTLVCASGKSASQGWQLSWLDSSGRIEPLMPTPGPFATPRISPDGRKVAFIGSGGDLYVYDLERRTPTRLTFTGGRNVPVWSPDGLHLLSFSSASGLNWTRSDGAEEAETVLRGNLPRPYSFTPDGRRLAYFERSVETGWDIWTVALDLTDSDHPKASKPEAFLRTMADELLPQFSPDGRWVAYRSNESGSPEIYVRPFPAAGGGKWPISAGGGLYAVWAKNGHELFYETTDNRIMVVDYSADGASFLPGQSRLWSDKQLFYAGTSNMDLAPDGKRFVVFSLPEAAPGAKESVHVTVLINFFDWVRKRLP
ncbi:MAG TPA: protein kinase [Bryobacteraceae bacterium]|nr:protein kinase [Bryobacteraceae bacterium]